MGVAVGAGVDVGSTKGVSVGPARALKGLDDVLQAKVANPSNAIPKKICFFIIGLYRKNEELSNWRLMSVNERGTLCKKDTTH
jgi:hypothetical protein